MTDAVAPTSPVRMAVAFVRMLRRAGLGVPVGSALAYSEALAATGVEERSRVYWAGRATLVRRPEDFPVYDRIFAAFWAGRERGSLLPVSEPLVIEIDEPAPDEEGQAPPSDEESDPARTITVRYSPTETLRDKDFATCTPEELAETRRLMAELRMEAARRRSRRMQRSPRRRGRHDGSRWARRTGSPALRRALRTVRRASGRPRRREERWSRRDRRRAAWRLSSAMIRRVSASSSGLHAAKSLFRRVSVGL